MIFGKQFVLDLIIVITIPVLIIGGYFFFWRTDTPSLSVSPAGAPSESEPGYKTKIALETLRSIRLDDSLFKDPSYLVLKPYVFEIPEVPLSRQYPFTHPQAVLDMINHGGLGTQSSSQ